MDDESDKQLVLQGQALALLNRQRKEAVGLESLDAYKFRVFSQLGEDGILQHLIEEAGIQAHERLFVEFGAQDTRSRIQGSFCRDATGEA